MKVRTERTTAGGDDKVETYEGDYLVNAEHRQPMVGGTPVLGTIIEVTDIDSGTVSFEDADGEVRSYGEVAAVHIPPVVSKLQLEFEAIPDQTFDFSALIGIESNE